MNAIIEESVSFAVADDQCHGVLTYPGSAAAQCLMLLLAPHPLLGGNMDNNVIQHLAARAAEDGAVTLRFNYRGVGASKRMGQSNTVSFFREMEAKREYHLLLPECDAAKRYLMKVVAVQLPLVIIGYSLGALLASMLANQSPSALSLCISPPTAKTGITHFYGFPGEKIFVAGDTDPFFDASLFDALFQTLAPPKCYLCLEGVDHFYRGDEDRLYQALRPFLPHLKPTPC